MSGPELPAGERSWWRYIQRTWWEFAASHESDYRMSKRQAKLSAYPSRAYGNKRRKRHGRR